MPAKWTFVLADARNMQNIGELTQARSRNISLALNRAGSASFVVPIDAELSEYIWPITAALKVYRKGSTGTKLVWSGYVSTIDEDWANNRMTVNCVGWIERLNKRILREELTYTDEDDAVIIQALLESVNKHATEHAGGVDSIVMQDGVTIYWPEASPNTPTFMKWGGTLPNQGSGGATAYVGADRSIKYPIYTTNVLQGIQQLVEIENGCDIFVDPGTRLFYVQRKRCRVLPEVILGFQTGTDNLAAAGRQIDASTLVNWHMTTGGVGTTPQSAVSVESMEAYGPFEETQSLSDVSGTEGDNVLAAYSGAEVVIRDSPRQLFSVTPFAWSEENSVPEPLVEYQVGDQIVLWAHNPPRVNNIHVQVRVFGMSISITEEGNETLSSLQVYPG